MPHRKRRERDFPVDIDRTEIHIELIDKDGDPILEGGSSSITHFGGDFFGQLSVAPGRRNILVVSTELVHVRIGECLEAEEECCTLLDFRFQVPDNISTIEELWLEICEQVYGRLKEFGMHHACCSQRKVG